MDTPRIVAPVRYPLTERSKRTIERAAALAEERTADLIVLHVDLYQEEGYVTRTQLKRAVERAFGRPPRVRYVVRRSFIIEQTILEEVADEGADVVVVGRSRVGWVRRTLRRPIGDPDVERLLREQADCEVVSVE
jgi:nucleotide-binding universal stress UspA family protein